MTHKILFSTILLITLLAITIPLTACSKVNATPGYILETLTKRDISFSFEHPEGYEKDTTSTSTLSESESPMVGEIYFAANMTSMTYKQLSIQLWSPTANVSNAKARLDYMTADIQDVGEHILITGRTPLQVAGINGERIDIVASLNVDESEGISGKIACIMVGFDYKGQIWLMILATNMEKPDEIQADFEHLLNTFKFLN